MKKRTQSYWNGLLLLAGLLGLGGCKESSPPAEQPKQPNDTELRHSHERGKMLITDAGKYHALLTAHLSPKGNELDLFFETAVNKSPTPVALPLASVKAHVRRAGEEDTKEVLFEPAPATERPAGEKPGTCSHFVAKVPWMRPTDTLSVTFFLELGDERHRVHWENFNPKKYAHHAD